MAIHIFIMALSLIFCHWNEKILFAYNMFKIRTMPTEKLCFQIRNEFWFEENKMNFAYRYRLSLKWMASRNGWFELNEMHFHATLLILMIRKYRAMFYGQLVDMFYLNVEFYLKFIMEKSFFKKSFLILKICSNIKFMNFGIKTPI